MGPGNGKYVGKYILFHQDFKVNCLKKKNNAYGFITYVVKLKKQQHKAWE